MNLVVYLVLLFTLFILISSSTISDFSAAKSMADQLSAAGSALADDLVSKARSYKISIESLLQESKIFLEPIIEQYKAIIEEMSKGAKNANEECILLNHRQSLFSITCQLDSIQFMLGSNGKVHKQEEFKNIAGNLTRKSKDI